jgi:hypothetical protein
MGAAASVDPVTATLPVVPGSVHSGAAPLAGAAVGQLLVAIWVTGDPVTAEAAGELADDADVSGSEPQAASVIERVVAQTTRAAEAEIREEFTRATLQRAPLRERTGYSRYTGEAESSGPLLTLWIRPGLTIRCPHSRGIQKGGFVR